MVRLLLAVTSGTATHNFRKRHKLHLFPHFKLLYCIFHGIYVAFIYNAVFMDNRFLLDQ